jgi:hypothetical protein
MERVRLFFAELGARTTPRDDAPSGEQREAAGQPA